MKTNFLVTLLTLGALADSPAQTAIPPNNSAPVSQRGTPGVAASRAVVNVAELPPLADGAGELPAFDAFAPAADGAVRAPLLAAASPPPNTISPDPASSFLAVLQSPGVLGESGSPDTHGAVGPNHIVTSVNIRLQIRDRQGTILRTVGYPEFWRPIDAAGGFCCDDRVLYDPYEDRWIVVGKTSSDAVPSATFLAVSQTGDPVGRWNLYRIPTDPTGTVGPDFPRIGFNKNWIVIQTLLLRKLPIADNFIPGFDIYALNKTNLYAGGVGAFTTFQLRTNFTVPHPVTTYDPSLSTFYLASAPIGPAKYGVEGTTNLNELKIYTISGAFGSEVLTDAVTIHTPFRWDGEPPGGYLPTLTNRQILPQLGSNRKPWTSVAAFSDAKLRNGSLWAVHEVFLPPGGSPTRVSVQWWQLGLDGTVLQHGLIDDPSGVQFFAYPSIAVNRFNDVLIGYSRFSTNQYPSANYSFRYGNDPSDMLRNDTVLKAGEWHYENAVEFGGVNVRWGDYSHTVVDPLNDTDLWTIQEYAATPSGGSDRWGTWWGRIVPSGSFLTATNVTVTEGDNGSTNAVFNFTLSRPTNVIVSVDFATVDGTALAGSDYAATSGTLVFAPGETNQTIVVPVFGDTLKETNETFYLTLSNPTNVSQSYGRLEARILDNDPLPAITINDIAVREGDAGLTDATFTLSLTPASGLPVSVRLTTANNSAVLRVDYVPTNIALTFLPGVTSLTATVKIIGDTLLETNETFFVSLGSPTNAVLGNTRGICTIRDDDFKVTVLATAGGDAQLSFATQTNRTYRVERTDNLAPPVEWTSVIGAATVPGTGSNVTVLDPGALNQPKRFYRVLTP